MAVKSNRYARRLHRTMMCAGRSALHSAQARPGAIWDGTQWEFDPASGANTAKTYADGSRVAYAHTTDGKRTRTAWARGAWRQDDYDARGLVSGTTYSDAATPSVAYEYADSGAVATATLSDGTSYGYSYDDRLLCTNESVVVGGEAFAVSRTYDGFRRASETAVVVTNVRHAAKVRLYDSEDRICGYALTNAAGRGVSVALAYDGSHVTNMVYTLPNGSRFSVNLTRERARKELVTRRDCAFGNQPVYWYEIGYDLLGRPTNAADSVSLVREWLYNRRSELAAAMVGTNRYGYAYDSIGNRLLASANAATNSYTANCLNQYASILCASASPREPTYDTDGNLTQDDKYSYAHDAENRPLSAYPLSPAVGSLAVENRYDHWHRRVQKIVKRCNGTTWGVNETHTFIWDGMNVVLEKVAFADGTARTFEYFWGMDKSGTEQGAGGVGGLLAVSVDGMFYVPCYDHNGNVVLYVSETGSIVAQYAYDPYGNVIGSSGPLADAFTFGFSTKCRDRETGLVAYQRRFYSPSLGRWLTRDPIEEEGGVNLYAFCGNMPVDICDIFGLACIVGTYNVLSLVVDAKPAANGLAYDPNLIRKGESLLSSIGMLDLLSASPSLMTGSMLSRLISALDIAAGKVSSPDNNAMEQIRQLLAKLKNGPIEVYGRLEYEMCICARGSARMVLQPPITDGGEIVLDPTDSDATRTAYKSVMRSLMEQLSHQVKLVKGVK